MRKQTLEDYIAGLTPEECEKHQALIHECLLRQRLINEYTHKACSSASQLNLSLEILNQKTHDLQNASRLLKEHTMALFNDLIPLLKATYTIKLSMN